MAVASLGAGSGVLTSTIIDQLKAADTRSIITPIDNKITLQKQKDSALSLLSSLLTTFKSSASALDDDGLYQERIVSGGTSAVSVTADAGVAVQSFSLSNIMLGQKNLQESGSFTSKSASVATGSGTMGLKINGSTINIDYNSSMTLDDLKTAINNQASQKNADGTTKQLIQASTLQVGAGDYRLILTSGSTGADQTITVSDSGTALNSALLKTASSASFTASTDKVASSASGTQIAKFTMGSNSYDISYTNTTTLEEFRDAINSATGSTTASIDSSNKLVIKSNSTSFSLVDAVTGALDSKLTAYTTSGTSEIQTARDASFTYNGVPLTRKTNSIDDIAIGMTINLLQESTSSSNISITQDTAAISDAMSSFVTNYNSLTSQLSSMTGSDVANGTVGIFNGDNSINSITREINKIITSINSDGFSLPKFGISLSQTGTMSFNSSTFSTEFNKDSNLSEKFFSGLTTVDTNGKASTVSGLFTSMNDLLDRYTKSNGIINNLTTGSATELKSLTNNRTRSQALLDARYVTMSARFVQYDTLMTRLTNQFASLSQQITTAANGG